MRRSEPLSPRPRGKILGRRFWAVTEPVEAGFAGWAYGAVLYATIIDPPPGDIFSGQWFGMGLIGLVFAFFNPIVAALSFAPAYVIARSAVREALNSERPPTVR